jgi:hypothetical protein
VCLLPAHSPSRLLTAAALTILSVEDKHNQRRQSNTVCSVNIVQTLHLTLELTSPQKFIMHDVATGPPSCSTPHRDPTLIFPCRFGVTTTFTSQLRAEHWKMTVQHRLVLSQSLLVMPMVTCQTCQYPRRRLVGHKRKYKRGKRVGQMANADEKRGKKHDKNIQHRGFPNLVIVILPSAAASGLFSGAYDVIACLPRIPKGIDICLSLSYFI